ncbi:MAG: ABC transporter ATP-binding protein [Bacillota bacterium]|nr:ABC transporter ATP-binding protein [Bacillota bacterium]
MTTSKLSIKNLNFSYKGKAFIENLTLDLDPGINVFLGPNGSGKTTLIKILATIYKAKSGAIFLNNIDYKDVNKIKNQIAYVPQKFSSYDDIKVEEYIDFISFFKDSKKEDYLNIFGIREYKDKKIKTLSEGMKKKLVIAGALALKPQLILLDEPSSGLDRESRAELREIYKYIKATYPQTIILYSSHLEEDIFQEVDQLVEIENGKIVFSGDLATYKESSQ